MNIPLNKKSLAVKEMIKDIEPLIEEDEELTMDKIDKIRQTITLCKEDKTEDDTPLVSTQSPIDYELYPQDLPGSGSEGKTITREAYESALKKFYTKQFYKVIKETFKNHPEQIYNDHRICDDATTKWLKASQEHKNISIIGIKMTELDSYWVTINLKNDDLLSLALKRLNEFTRSTCARGGIYCIEQRGIDKLNLDTFGTGIHIHIIVFPNLQSQMSRPRKFKNLLLSKFGGVTNIDNPHCLNVSGSRQLDTAKRIRYVKGIKASKRKSANVDTNIHWRKQFTFPNGKHIEDYYIYKIKEEELEQYNEIYEKYKKEKKDKK